MSITANIFTFAGDACLLPACIRALLQSNADMQIHIIDDANHPISQATLKSLVRMSTRIHYRRSEWERGGNLNGQAAALGILREMRRSCGDRAGVSIKIDSDTLLLNAGWIDRCIANHVALLYSLRPPVAPSGMCYLIANEWIQKIEKAVQAIELPPSAAEDVSILSIGQAIAHRSSVICLLPQGYSNPHGAWTAWDYQLAEDIIPQVAAKIDVITLGNWKFDGTKSRLDAIKTSSQILDYLATRAKDNEQR